MFFYLPKLIVLFENRQQSNARAGQKKHMVFFGNARPKSNMRGDLKQRKNIEALLMKKITTITAYYAKNK